jgi:hypothetical protein
MGVKLTPRQALHTVKLRDILGRLRHREAANPDKRLVLTQLGENWAAENYFHDLRKKGSGKTFCTVVRLRAHPCLRKSY